LGVLEQLGQVVEADGDFGMVEPEARFIDGQRSLVPYMPQSILNEEQWSHGLRFAGPRTDRAAPGDLRLDCEGMRAMRPSG
jgi:hypothetical protein